MNSGQSLSQARDKPFPGNVIRSYLWQQMGSKRVGGTGALGEQVMTKTAWNDPTAQALCTLVHDVQLRHLTMTDLLREYRKGQDWGAAIHLNVGDSLLFSWVTYLLR